MQPKPHLQFLKKKTSPMCLSAHRILWLACQCCWFELAGSTHGWQKNCINFLFILFPDMWASRVIETRLRFWAFFRKEKNKGSFMIKKNFEVFSAKKQAKLLCPVSHSLTSGPAPCWRATPASCMNTYVISTVDARPNQVLSLV